MTISQWHTNFKVGVDKVSSLNSASFLPEEIDVLFNNNIEKFVATRMYGNNPRKEGFEDNQKRYDDLITLVANQNYSTFFSGPNNKPNGKIVSYPADYWHTIEEEAGITYVDCNSITQSKRVPVVPVTHDRYDKVIRDPYHQPNENKILRLGLGGGPELITGTAQTLTNYFLRYIKRPASVQYGSTYAVPSTDVNCDLPDSTHQEILRLAVAEALENIESKRYPTADREVTTQE